MSQSSFRCLRTSAGRLAAGVVVLWLTGLGDILPAQQNYGSYFTEQGAKYGGQLGTQSTSRYLYDKYFYHRPSVSPYVNLGRPDPMGGTSYHSFVRPEQQRRAAEYKAQTAHIDQLKRSGRVGGIHDPAANYRGSATTGFRPPSKPSAYHNHWYGNWQR